MNFLPEYSSMEVRGRYRPMFRLFDSAGWKYVRRGGVPIECDSATDAVKAAKECVKAILNPPIRATEDAQNIPETVPDGFDVDAWRERKAEEAATERERVFSGTIFMGGGRTVQVETKRRARA